MPCRMKLYCGTSLLMHRKKMRDFLGTASLNVSEWRVAPYYFVMLAALIFIIKMYNIVSYISNGVEVLQM